MHTYINPPVLLSCKTVLVHAENQIKIGVIEIIATEKPHKVARSIDTLTHNDVFVRHGTVVTKASPEEIINMRNEPRYAQEQQQLEKAGDIHLTLNNILMAVEKYTQAIDLKPNAKLLLKRGKVYTLLFEDKKKDREYTIANDFRSLALKDFSNTLELSCSLEEEKIARIERIKLLAETGPNYMAQAWKDDLAWSQSNIEGQELGEVFYLKAERISQNTYLFDDGYAEYAYEVLNQAIQLGYKEPKVYFLRAQACCGMFNHGLALQDIELAISLSGETILDFLGLKAYILFKMNRYEEVFLFYQTVYQKHKVNCLSFFDITFNIEEDILCRFAIEYKFGESYNKHRLENDIHIMNMLSYEEKYFVKQYPEIAKTINEMKKKL